MDAKEKFVGMRKWAAHGMEGKGKEPGLLKDKDPWGLARDLDNRTER